MKLKLPRTHILIVIVLATLFLSSFLIIAQSPVHHTDIEYSDALGDASDPDVDIIRLRSYREDQNIVLEMTVAGQIQTSSNHLYRITIVAKGIADDNSHVYSCTFIDGELTAFDFDTEVDNDTLRIYFPLSAFIMDSYMIGLEGDTDAPGLGEDFTGLDRDGEVSRFLFRIW
ncbi:MAG: hypothetical protein ACW98Y_07710 [Candidatus Thorarchaeota archaeon]